MRYSKFFLLFLILIGLSFSGYCQTASVNNGCLPLSVNFTGPSNSVSYFWDFKDGVTSNLKNPTNSFTTAGTYNVTFQETPTGPILGTIKIEVYAMPALSVTATTGCAPVNITLKATSVMNSAISISNYNWVYGDGQTTQGPASTVVHNYSSPGIYTPSIAIETNFPSCNNTQAFPQKVNLLAPPVASFTTNPIKTDTCGNNLNITYTNTTSFTQTTTYAWKFGNGNTSILQSPPSQNYVSGSYTATLTASYKGIPGCTTATSQAIKVGRPPVVIAAKKQSICIYDQAVVKTTTPGSYSWNIGSNAVAADLDEDNIADLNKDSVVIAYTIPGNHTVTLTVTTPDGQCTDSKSLIIYVDSLTAHISPPTGFTCSSPKSTAYQAISNQTNVTYEWNLEQPSQTEITKTVNRTYLSELDPIYYSGNTLESFTADLTITSTITGCKATDESTLNMWLPNAQFKCDLTKGCAPLTVRFSDTSRTYPDYVADLMNWPRNHIITWKWIFDDGQTQTNSNNLDVFHTYTNPGEYLARLVVTTDLGCTDTSYAIQIEVGTTVNTVDFTADLTSVCPGDPIQFTVVNPSALVDGYHFVVDNNKAFHCAANQSVSWSYKDVVGPQDVTLMLDYNGCYTPVTKSNFITVNGAVAKIDYFALCKQPMDYNFESKSLGANSISWNFGDSQTSISNTVVHTYASSGNYQVKLTATGTGCPPTTDIVNITPRNIKAKLKIDTLLCINQPYVFSSSNSSEVNANCNSGYVWQFPDFSNMRPYTTQSSNATFIFQENGIHTIELVVKDINGCRDTTRQKIKVFDMTVPQPTSSKVLDICNPTIVDFKDHSTGDTTLVSWHWNFGDGQNSILNNQLQFNHTYSTIPPDHHYIYPPFDLILPPYYNLILTVTDALGCSERDSININYYKPVSAIIPSPKATLCLGDSVILSAPDFTSKGSNLSYSWNLGNGQSSTVQTNNPIYYPVGDNTVKLVYTEVSSGCKDSTTAIISVQSYPSAKISTDHDSLSYICAPANIVFSDTAVKSISPIAVSLWDFGNGNQSSSPGAWYYEKGIYQVKLRVETSYGCADTTSKILDLVRPEGTFTMDKSQICRYEEIKFALKDTLDITSYRWEFGDGLFTENQDSISHKYDFHPPSGSTVAKLILKKGICPYTAEAPVGIYEVIAGFDRLNGTDTSICFQTGGSYSFTNTSTGFDTFGWNFGDNTTSTDYNPVHQFLTPGNYNVALSVANNAIGCKDTIRKTAYVYPNPQVIGIGDTVCSGNILNLFVQNPDTSSRYTWSPSTGLSSVTDTNVTASIQHTINYLLTEKTKNGCIGSTNVNAIVIESGHLSNWDTTIVIGDAATLPAFGYPVYKFTWTPTDGLSCLNCNYPKASPLKDMDYSINVTDVRGCFNEDYLFSIKVRPETFIKMPTAFTPNGSGQNDKLYVRGWGIKDLISFQIFNRWGQELYNSADLNEGWDGRFRGTLQNEDEYVYKVKVHDWREKELYLEGYVNLLH